MSLRSSAEVPSESNDRPSLGVRTSGRSIEDAVVRLGEDREAGRLTVRDEQVPGCDDRMLDVLESISTDRFVVDPRHPPGTPHFDSGFAAAALAALHSASV